MSTQDQKLRVQLDAAESAQCNQIFKDHGVSGGKQTAPARKLLRRQHLH
ncbi:hypothetical protein [uncultured Hyphomicrobium sp.]